MKIKSVKKLAIASLVIQVVILLMIVIITIGQSAAKTAMNSPEEIMDIMVIPYGDLIHSISMLLVFAVGFFIILKTDVERTGLKAGILLAIACLCSQSTWYQSLITAIIVHTSGAAELAAYATLQSVIGYNTGLLQTVAFAIFCLALGGYVGAGRLEEEIE